MEFYRLGLVGYFVRFSLRFCILLFLRFLGFAGLGGVRSRIFVFERKSLLVS